MLESLSEDNKVSDAKVVDSNRLNQFLNEMFAGVELKDGHYISTL